jgi:single-strand DNA-binding protein
MAGTYNRVIIIGRLGRDPELRYSNNGSPVCNMSLATDEGYKDRDGNKQDRTEWHKCVVWGKQAEYTANYLQKGSMALVEGSLQNNKWQDQQGNNRVSTEIKAFRVVFMDSKQQVTGNQGKPSQDDPFAFSGGATDDSQAPF